MCYFKIPFLLTGAAVVNYANNALQQKAHKKGAWQKVRPSPRSGKKIKHRKCKLPLEGSRHKEQLNEEGTSQ